jgi:hypothetical protein
MPSFYPYETRQDNNYKENPMAMEAWSIFAEWCYL